MKKVVLMTAALLVGLAFSGCEKNDNSASLPPTNTDTQQPQFKYVVTLSSSNYVKNISEKLVRPIAHKGYSAGKIEYIENERVAAIVEFKPSDGHFEDDEKCNCDGSKDYGRESTHKSSVTKVITDPLVKVEGCDHYVDGTIEYFKGEQWIYTIELGDGECDSEATKITAKGPTVFDLNDYKWK